MAFAIYQNIGGGGSPSSTVSGTTAGGSGGQPIEDTSTTQKHAIGTRVLAYDPVQGEGEFIYLKGLASTAVGDVVVFNQYTGVTTRATTRSKGLVGVAMSANVANQFGWYQIRGLAIVNSTSAAADASVYSSATAGTVLNTVVAGDIVYGATFASANGTPATGKAYVSLFYPSMHDTDNA